MKLGMLIVEEWNFMCAKFQIPTMFATAISCVIQSCHILMSLHGVGILKISKSISTEGCKMKLGMLVVEEWNFICTKLQIPSNVWHCSSWLFKVVAY